MDIASIVIGILFLLAFTLPFFFLNRSQKSNHKVLAQVFSQAAAKHGLNIPSPEFWGRVYAIGLDETANKLLYLKHKEGSEQEALIDLAEVEKCKVENHSRTVKNHNVSTKMTDRMELVFSFKEGHKHNKALEFYHMEESLTVADELQIAEKWARRLNGLATKSK